MRFKNALEPAQHLVQEQEILRLRAALGRIREICCGAFSPEAAASEALGQVGVIAGAAIGIIPDAKAKWLPEDYADLVPGPTK